MLEYNNNNSKKKKKEEEEEEEEEEDGDAGRNLDGRCCKSRQIEERETRTR